MSLRFKKCPLCEQCCVKEATVFLHCKAGREWEFCCELCTEEDGTGHYPVAITRFFNDPASTVDWLAHLHEKAWFKAEAFVEMMHRFREATGSFNTKG